MFSHWLIDLNFVAATCRRSVHTWQGCLRLFCRCEMSHEFKLVWFGSDKILSQRQWFSHLTLGDFLQQPVGGEVSKRFVASCVSTLKLVLSIRTDPPLLQFSGSYHLFGVIFSTLVLEFYRLSHDFYAILLVQWGKHAKNAGQYLRKI